MPLDQNALHTAIKAAFDKASTAIQTNPNAQTADQVAADLATAIATFVKGGDVTQVTVQVVNASNVVIGTGAQTGVGKIT